MQLVILYFEFFKIGLFAVSGGLASLPFLYQIAGNYTWLEANAIPDMLAVVQMLPGAIGVNLAAYTGNNLMFIAGSLIACAGYVTAPVIIISIIAGMLDKFKTNKIVQGVFAGATPAACGLLAAAGCGVLQNSLWQENIVRVKECVILLCIFILMKATKKPPALFIALGAITGIILKL